MIEARHLSKRYGTLNAVNDVSFTADAGDILGFLGPNGAGKSTTMRILTGYTPPTLGQATVAGFDLRRESLELRRAVGYLPESNPLYGEMTVRGYVDFMAQLKGAGDGNSGRRRAAVDEALEETGLGHVSGRIIGNLSKGYRQRTGLAQALVGNPRVLVLDEPTVGLDPTQIREIRTLIGSMRGRRTVLLSTHILPEVSMTCNKVVILNEGRIEASGTPENLVSAYTRDAEVRVIAGGDAESLERALKGIEGVDSVQAVSASAGASSVMGQQEWRLRLSGKADVRPAIARGVVEAGGQLYELRSLGLSLEDVFLRVVSGGHRDEDGPPGPDAGGQEVRG